jgi:hypothetical protein
MDDARCSRALALGRPIERKRELDREAAQLWRRLTSLPVSGVERSTEFVGTLLEACVWNPSS